MTATKLKHFLHSFWFKTW